jgi:hypothetical protein
MKSSLQPGTHEVDHLKKGIAKKSTPLDNRVETLINVNVLQRPCKEINSQGVTAMYIE